MNHLALVEFRIVVLLVLLPTGEPIKVSSALGYQKSPSPRSRPWRVQRIRQGPSKVVDSTPEQVKLAQDQVRSMQEELITLAFKSNNSLVPSIGRGKADRWSHLHSLTQHSYIPSVEQLTYHIYPPPMSLAPSTFPSILPHTSCKLSVARSTVANTIATVLDDDWVPTGEALRAQMYNNLLKSIGASKIEAQKAANRQRAKIETHMRTRPMRIQRLRNRTNPSQVLLVSASTHVRPWTENVTWNQNQWTSMHGSLKYEFLNGNKTAGLLDKGFAPQWLKIRVLQNQMQNALAHQDKGLPTPEFILWIDDDIVITNPKNFVEDMVDRMDPEHHMMIARDAGDPDSGVNSGLMLFRTTRKALQLLDLIWKMSAHKVWKHRTQVRLGTCQNQQCLHEQEGINILRVKNHKFRSAVKVVAPVDDDLNMNTFFRDTHFDDKRRLWIKYDKDPEEYMWDAEKGMNTCHVTGMVENLRTAYIDECLVAAKKAFKRKAYL